MNLREKLNNILLLESKNNIKYQITKYIVESININKYPTIIEISDKCFVAKSSVVRYAKNFGLQGYKEFINKIKFEDQISYDNDIYSNPIDTKVNKEFLIFKESLINFIEGSDKYLVTLEKIKTEIIKAKKIYIHSSYEFDNLAEYMKNFLILVNKNVVYSNHKKTSSITIDFIEESDLQIFLVAGVDNNYLETIFAYSMKNNKCKKILISSESQANKFQNCHLNMILSFSDDYLKVYNKEIKMLYLLKQLLILLESETKNINFKNLKHKF